ncbi:MAG TPA: ATP synthase F1 subunit delta [Ignavibacteriales bacterium]|nr:ATP synthase F1 subunit delta [Ignavibacteriales bacterium]
MKPSTVSYRYAKAYFQNSIEDNSIDTVFNDFLLLLDVFSSVKEIKTILANPIIKNDKKIEIIEEIFKNKVNQKTLKFLIFVIEQNRADILKYVIEKFVELYYDYKGIIQAEIKSYIELTTEQKQNLINKLERITNKKINCKFYVENNIGGGFIIYLNDLVYDYSFNKQIIKLRAELLK